jgi:predicted DNA-binding protein (UPF0278 family)
MKKNPPHHFHVRLPSDLFASIVDSMRRKGGKSLNKEIVEQLRETNSKFAAEESAKDDASRIADALRPLLETLEQAESEHVSRLLIEAAQILTKRKKRGRRPPSP